jgi:antitoxin PrlF
MVSYYFHASLPSNFKSSCKLELDYNQRRHCCTEEFTVATLTITPEGTLTVPKELVKDIGKPGEQVQLERLPNGSVILKPSEAASLPKKTGKIQDLFGCLAGKSEVHLTIEEMNEAIRKAGAEAGMAGLKQ